MLKYWKKGLALLLAAVMLLGCCVSAYAKDASADEIQGTVEDEVTVEEGDKPFLSFGADLRKDEKAKVLELLGVKEEDLGDYDVITITNEEEHEYLGEYISADKIGNRALSSVVVMQGEKGSGIQVTTKNINYCTAGMYENALATAGLQDAEVIVAGPFEISGTAALLGAIRAYSVMTGEKVDEDVIDGAVNEIVTTGKIEADTGSAEEVEGMIAYLKEQIAGKNLSADEIQSKIEEAADKFNVTLGAEQKQDLSAFLEKFQGLDLNLDSLKNQAQSVYDKLKELGSNMDTEALTQQAEGFFAKIIAFIKQLFSKLG